MSNPDPAKLAEKYKRLPEPKLWPVGLGIVLVLLLMAVVFILTT